MTGDAGLHPGEVVRWLAEHSPRAYLVGGCLRDRLLGRPVHDLDVVVAAGGLALARRVADAFGGAYYPLDEERGTGRALLPAGGGRPLVVDVSEFRGPDLPSDLADRDFTVNALAEELARPGRIVDLLGGLDDLRAGILRPAGPLSIRRDPLRALRAVRLAAELGFRLAAEAERQIRQDGPAVAHLAAERIRDELSRILALPHSAPSFRLLDELGLLTVVLPELEPLRAMEQPAPHWLDGLAHSLETLAGLDRLVAPLAFPSASWPPGGPEEEAGRWPGVVGALVPRLAQHLAAPMGDLRPRLVTLKLAALLHDTGKPSVMTRDPSGRLRFVGHERASAAIAAGVLKRLRFNGAEARLAEAVAAHHLRPLLLAAQPAVGDPAARPEAPGPGVSARAIVRFFRDTGEAGIDVVLHALADHQATYRPGSAPQAWQRLLGLAAQMLGDYFARYSEEAAPPPLLDGHKLMRELGLPPGRRVGELLAAVREAQLCGDLSGRDEALELVGRLLRTTGG